MTWNQVPCTGSRYQILVIWNQFWGRELRSCAIGLSVQISDLLIAYDVFVIKQVQLWMKTSRMLSFLRHDVY